MTAVKRIVLDVLKPHHPNVLDFARAIAESNSDCDVRISVSAVDEKTESVVVEITGGDIDFASVSEMITEMGGSVHSIDEVHVVGDEVS